MSATYQRDHFYPAAPHPDGEWPNWSRPARYPAVACWSCGKPADPKAKGQVTCGRMGCRDRYVIYKGQAQVAINSGRASRWPRRGGGE